jgi:ABC-2 type transport system permease protein
MAGVYRLTLIELKLFLRDPFTVIFTFAYPFFVLFVLANVFGNELQTEEDIRVWRGVGPTDYYVPAYIGLVFASIGLLALPLRLAGYREQGVLRRFRASGLSLGAVLGSQIAVAFLMAVVGALSIALAARLAFDTFWPRDFVLLLPGFLLGFLAFAGIGVLMGAVLPNSRAAQAAGLILFFVMFLLSGAGPPREVLGNTMETIGGVLPLTHVILVLQDPWLGYGWSTISSVVVAVVFAGAVVLTARFFRWE